MKKHTAPEGAQFKYRVTRVSHGYIVEEAYVTATSEEEAYEKLMELELDSDFEIVRDEMSVEEETIKRCHSEEKEHA